jgi:hypothetical protein
MTLARRPPLTDCLHPLASGPFAGLFGDAPAVVREAPPPALGPDAPPAPLPPHLMGAPAVPSSGVGVSPGDLVTFTVGGLEDRMKVISYVAWLSIADPFTAEWVSQVTANVRERDDEGEIRAVFAALKARVRYQFHPRNTDRFQTLRRTWEMGAADCDCATIALVSALHTLGFAVGGRIVSGDGDTWEHIYGLVGFPRNAPSQAIPLDLTIGPDGTPRSALPGFELPLSRMAAYRDFRFDLAL